MINEQKVIAALGEESAALLQARVALASLLIPEIIC